MEKKTQILLVAVLAIVTFYIFKGDATTHQDNDVFAKKQECSQHLDLVNQKIKDSGRVFESEHYTVNEVFFSPSKNSCLYAFTINNSGSELYNIYDLFGGEVYVGSIAEEFQKQRAELKL